MSQRSEKYARAMERRVARLEERMEQIGHDMTAQGVRMSTAEELLEVMAMPTHVIKATQDRDKLDALIYSAKAEPYVMTADWEPSGNTAAEDRRTVRRESRRKRVVRRRVSALCLAILAMILLVIVVARASAETGAPQGPVAAAEPQATMAVLTIPKDVAAAELDVWDGTGEDPLEPEKIEEALLASGYFSTAVPMSYDLQDYMRTYCAEYGCPYPLALAVAEVESRFDMEAVGAIGEAGIMQLNPGPGGSYHDALEEATGLDPTTPSGNIAAGCYLLGKYMTAYEDPAKAAMAYNMGESGAREAWASGITSTTYSTNVLEAMERWEVTVNAWNGI